jgi:hypothetical protein
MAVCWPFYKKEAQGKIILHDADAVNKGVTLAAVRAHFFDKMTRKRT